MTMVLNGTSGVTTNSGTLISATTIGVGGTTPSASGAGISFPATQSASSDGNTLDDYEEGTWTPADNSGAGLSFTLVNCRYVKVGNLVTVTGRITWPATANTAQTIITLPFNCYQGSFSVSTNYNVNVYGYFSGSLAYLFGVGQSAITNANMSAKELDVSISFITS
jgi:hypothetical protein